MILRVAKHTNDLFAIEKFYTEVIGLVKIGAFEKHEGYEGIFLGQEGANFHLEFTASEEAFERTEDDDDMIVFFFTKEEYDKKIASLKDIKVYESRNPYWNRNGILIRDPDGNKVVISYR